MQLEFLHNKQSDPVFHLVQYRFKNELDFTDSKYESGILAIQRSVGLRRYLFARTDIRRRRRPFSYLGRCAKGGKVRWKGETERGGPFSISERATNFSAN